MEERIKILLIEDDKIDQMAFERLVGRQDLPYDYQIAGSVSEARETLATERFDVVLIDYLLGDGTAFDLFDKVRDIPIIMMTGSGDEAIAVQAIKAGAYDYLTKDPEGNYLTTLAVVVDSVISHRLAEEKLEQYQEHLEELVKERTAKLSIANEQLRAEIAERVRGERALKESEQRYRALFEGAAEGILVADVETRTFRYANKAICEMLGYSEKELRQMSVSDIHPKKNLAHIASQLEAQMRGEEKLASNVPCLRKDGTTMYADVNTAKVLIDRKECAVGFFTDITKRKWAEKERGRYIERLRTLRAIDGAILSAWTSEEIARSALRHIQQLVPCLQASISRFDFETQEAIVLATCGGSGAELQSGARFPLEVFLTLDVLQQGRVGVVEDLASLTQPSSLHQALVEMGIRAFISVPLIAQGKLVGELDVGSESPGGFAPEHVDIAREIGDQIAIGLHQTHMRTALESEQRRLQALVERLPEGIFLLDSKRHILLANPTARAYLSHLGDADVSAPLTHLGGQPLETLLAPPAGEMPYHELTTDDTPPRTFEVESYRVKAEPEAGDRVLVVRDVTQEREIQEHIQQQERLAAVGQLAAGIAHDFNNIMGSIVLYAGLALRDPELSPRFQKYMKIVAQQAKRAAELIDQILDFSRKAVLERQPMNLLPFIKELVKLLGRTLPENIELKLDYGREAYTIHADPTRMQQVIMNLALNARDAMPEGGELRIGLARDARQPDAPPPLPEMALRQATVVGPSNHQDAEPEEWVQLTVSDTGTGIPSDVLPHIFEPFFTTKERGRGTGLGLAQVYGIVKQHEGHIDVTTEEGTGTAFTIYLPALAVAVAEAPPEAPDVNSLAKGSGEKILVVEDDQNTRAALLDSLEMMGYKGLAAQNGREALEVFEQHAEEIALVISDLVMPELGGMAFLRILKEGNPQVKVVILTGYPLDDKIEALRAAGIVDWLSKPLDLDGLARIVHRTLKGERRPNDEYHSRSSLSP